MKAAEERLKRALAFEPPKEQQGGTLEEILPVMVEAETQTPRKTPSAAEASEKMSIVDERTGRSYEIKIEQNYVELERIINYVEGEEKQNDVEK